MTSDPMPQGSVVLRTNTGEWLERHFAGTENGRYWPDIQAARACAKGFSRIHSGVRVNIYQVRGCLPWWVETWRGGVRTVPIQRPEALRAAA